MRKEWLFVVVSIYRCEGLPVMDGALGLSGTALSTKSKTDAYCEFSFGGAKPVKTKIRVVKGDARSQMNPVFNYDLWYPVSIPTMTQVRDKTHFCRA